MYIPVQARNAGTISTSAVSYSPIFYVAGIMTNNSEFANSTVAPNAGTLSNLYVGVTTAPGVGKSWVVTLRKNGADTGLSVTISDNATTGYLAGNPVTFVQGDTLCFGVTPSGTPAVQGYLHTHMLMESTSQMITGNWGGSAVISNNRTRYGVPWSGGNGINNTSISEGPVHAVVAAAGTFSNLFVSISGTPGTSQTHAYTLLVNGSPSTLTTTISGAGSTGSDTTHSVSVAVGDVISIQAAGSASANVQANVRTSMSFTPTDGKSCIYAGSLSNGAVPSTSVTNYKPLLGSGTDWTTTESFSWQWLGPGTIRNLMFWTGVAPGSGKSWTLTLNNGGVATPMSVTLSNTATFASLTQDYVVQPYDLISMAITPSGTPAAIGNITTGFSMSFPNPGKVPYGFF